MVLDSCLFPGFKFLLALGVQLSRSGLLVCDDGWEGEAGGSSRGDNCCDGCSSFLHQSSVVRRPLGLAPSSEAGCWPTVLRDTGAEGWQNYCIRDEDCLTYHTLSCWLKSYEHMGPKIDSFKRMDVISTFIKLWLWSNIHYGIHGKVHIWHYFALCAWGIMGNVCSFLNQFTTRQVCVTTGLISWFVTYSMLCPSRTPPAVFYRQKRSRSPKVSLWFLK